MAIKIDSGYRDDENIKKSSDNTNHNNDLEYIKNIIKEGVEICKKKERLVDELIKDIEVFEPIGINVGVSSLLEQIKHIFEVVGPSVLLGDYDKLIEYNTSGLDDEEAIEVYKHARKKIINNLKDNK